jgi:hypothetical protein
MKYKEKSVNVPGKQNLFCYFLVGVLVLVCLGCRSGPVFAGDAAYRSVEQDVERTGAGLAVTGAALSAGAERAAGYMRLSWSYRTSRSCASSRAWAGEP